MYGEGGRGSFSRDGLEAGNNPKFLKCRRSLREVTGAVDSTTLSRGIRDYRA
jgi:hypothetical protein